MKNLILFFEKKIPEFRLIKPIPPTLTRFVISYVFISSGWTKLTHLVRTVTFFQSVGIPGAKILAPVVGLVELVCGILIGIGLKTRFASLPLIIIMIVAIRTAQIEEITHLSGLLSLPDFLYIILLSWLLVTGPGILSLDESSGQKPNRKK